ncbi:MAG: hypothetical protein ACK4GQ_00885 [Candidatus Hadarchaeales archaeon]
MPQIQITLTPPESKRLIGKGVAALPEVKAAFRDGLIIIGVGSTNAYVVEELLGKKIEKERFLAGVILPKGACVVPEDGRLPPVIIKKGKVVDMKIEEAADHLQPGDVVIKGANALDASGTAGIFLASKRGGTIGQLLGYIAARGVEFIIPVGLEKFIPGSVDDVSRKTGIFKFDYARGCAVGMMPVKGRIITEIEAVKILTGAEAHVMGKGGISGAEGSVTLLIEGSASQLKKVKAILRQIEGEKPLKVETSCSSCDRKDCFLHP